MAIHGQKPSLRGGKGKEVVAGLSGQESHGSLPEDYGTSEKVADFSITLGSSLDLPCIFHTFQESCLSIYFLGRA